ncbi:MAG: DUF1122 family protein [Chloroflexi bacterium]|nr:DUF1122 family protein [Chloroflexota bacterium]
MIRHEVGELIKSRFPCAEDRDRLARLAQRGWLPLPDDSSHPLRRLQGQSVGGFRLQLLLGPRNRYGADYFQMFLQDSHGRAGQEPVVMALHHSGRYPGYNWVEVISLASRVSFAAAGSAAADVVELQSDLVRRLFQHLADVIPPGGHLMVEYDSPEQQVTERALALGVPPAATPLGSLLLEIGCGAGFRDWHFAEGGSEGSRKLMGFKATDPEIAGIKAQQIARELLEYLEKPGENPSSKVEAAALRRAAAVLQKLLSREPELAQHLQRAVEGLAL